MELKYTERTFLEVDYSDLNSFIKDLYGHDFECVADQEWTNYSKHEFNISKSDHESMFDSDVEKLQTWKDTGKGQYLLRFILEDLVAQGKIPEGRYLIDVFW